MSPSDNEIKQLAIDWIDYQKIALDPKTCTREFRKAVEQGTHPLSYAIHEIEDYLYSYPDAAWQLILELMILADTPLLLANIAAGPLETLLHKYPYQYIDRIEQQAKKDKKFKECLGYVWQGGVPEEIWRRIIKDE
jgi:hypothetical protein